LHQSAAICTERLTAPHRVELDDVFMLAGSPVASTVPARRRNS